MLSRSLLLLCLLSFIISCKQKSELTAEQKTTIEQEVKQMLGNYFADIKKSGLAAEFRYLDNSIGFSWTPPGFESAISYDSVAGIIKQNAAKYKSADNSFEKLKVVALNEEAAFYSGKILSVMTDTSGTTMKYRLVETGIVIKREDGWKLLTGQTSLINH